MSEDILSTTSVSLDAGEEAVELYKRILLYTPQDLEIWQSLGEVYAAIGKSEKARDEYLFLTSIYIRRGALDKAIDTARRVVAIYPEDVNSRFKMVRIFTKLGLKEEAREVYLQLVDFFMQKHLFFKAIEIFQQLIELEPDNLEYRVKLVDLLMAQELKEEALKHYLSLVNSYESKGMIVQARDTLNKIITLQPDNREAVFKLSDFYYDEGNMEEAILTLNRLLEYYLSKEDTKDIIVAKEKIIDTYFRSGQQEKVLELKEELAQLYLREGDEDIAINIFKEVAESYLDLTDSNKFLALSQRVISLYLGREDLEKAVTEYKDMIGAIIPLDRNKAVELAGELIKLMIQREKIVDMDLVIKDVARIFIENEDMDSAIEVYFRMGQAYIQLYKLDEAINIFREIIRLDNERLEARLKLADLYIRKDNLPLAIDEYMQVIRLYIDRDEIKKAMEVFEKAQEFASDNADLHYRIGQIFYGKGNWDYAQEYFGRALEIDSHHSKALVGTAMTYARQGYLKEMVELAKKLVAKGIIAEIIEEYKKTVVIGEYKAETYLALGNLYRELGFIEEAIIEFQKASRDPYMRLKAYNMLALCFKEQGFIDLAIRQLRKGIDSPDYNFEETMELRYNLAKIYEEVNMFEEAQYLYNEIYIMDIHYRDVADRIKELSKLLSEGVDSKVISLPQEKGEIE